eukprot:1218061-Amphidinium_carterae.1
MLKFREVEAFSDPYGSAVSDIDQLKRHVGKLSQIRRETSHIEDSIVQLKNYVVCPLDCCWC